MSDNLGGFASLIYNPDARNQVRLVGSLRGDHYQVPNTPEQQDLGIRDIQRERDAFLNFSWARVLAPGSLLTVSPFYHRNRAAFDGGSGDKPFIATDDRISSYIGGEVSLSIVKGKHNLRTGVTALGQKDDSALSLRSADGEVPPVEQSEKVWGNLQAAYAEEQYKITTWLTLNGGLRLTHFAGRLTENAASPRAGAALRIPRLNWVVRGFYGRYYQPPPLNAISGPLLDLALQEGFDFLPLPGERDIQREIGLAIPFKGWAFDLSRFHTNARNFFDHTPLGNANIFFPLTIEAARIRGTEATVRSPLLLHRVLLHLAYSRQYVQGRGRITGGLTDFSPPESGYFYLDHDQRDTLTAGFEANLPWQAWIAGNTAIGSGFLDGDGPDHLPMHTTFDIACGRSFGERLSLRLNMLNLTNHRYLLDNSNTFGGTHFNYPRQISVTLRFRFHY